MKTKLLVIIAVLLAGVAVGAWATKPKAANPNQSVSHDATQTKPTPDPSKPSQDVSLSGEVVCLPHKDTTGPQTDECAFGLRADDGKYYGLSDTTDDYSLVSKLPTGKKVKVTGTFQAMDSQKYQSIGTIYLKTVE